MSMCENFARIYYHPASDEITLVAKKTYFEVVDSIIAPDIGHRVYIGITGEHQMLTLNTQEFLEEECIMIDTFTCGKKWEETRDN